MRRSDTHPKFSELSGGHSTAIVFDSECWGTGVILDNLDTDVGRISIVRIFHQLRDRDVGSGHEPLTEFGEQRGIHCEIFTFAWRHVVRLTNWRALRNPGRGTLCQADWRPDTGRCRRW